MLPADRTVGAGVATSVTVTFTDPGTLRHPPRRHRLGRRHRRHHRRPGREPVQSHPHASPPPAHVTVEGCVTDDDNGVDCDTMIVTVDGNGAPVAVDDSATTAEDTAVDIAVLANDTDPDPATR